MALRILRKRAKKPRKVKIVMQNGEVIKGRLSTVTDSTIQIGHNAFNKRDYLVIPINKIQHIQKLKDNKDKIFFAIIGLGMSFSSLVGWAISGFYYPESLNIGEELLFLTFFLAGLFLFFKGIFSLSFKTSSNFDINGDRNNFVKETLQEYIDS